MSLGGAGSCLGNVEERSSGQVGASVQVEAHTGVVGCWEQGLCELG